MEPETVLEGEGSEDSGLSLFRKIESMTPEWRKRYRGLVTILFGIELITVGQMLVELGKDSLLWRQSEPQSER